MYLRLGTFKKELNTIYRRTIKHKVDPSFIVFGAIQLSDELCKGIKAEGFELTDDDPYLPKGHASILVFNNVRLHTDKGLSPPECNVLLIPLHGEGYLQVVNSADDEDDVTERSFDKYYAFTFDDTKLHCFFSKGDRKCVALAIYVKKQ